MKHLCLPQESPPTPAISPGHTRLCHGRRGRHWCVAASTSSGHKASVTQSSCFESFGCFTVNVTRVVRKKNCCHLTPSQVLHLQTAGASYLDSLFATQLNWDLTVKPLLRQERFDFNLSQIGFSNLFFFLWRSSNTLAFIFSSWIVANIAGIIIQMRVLPEFSLLYIRTFHLSSVPHQVFFLLSCCHDICDLWLLCFMPQFFPSSHCDTADPIWMPHGHKTPTNLVSQLRGDSGASQELFFSTGVLPKENVRYYAMTQMKPELTRAASLQISRFNILSC